MMTSINRVNAPMNAPFEASEDAKIDLIHREEETLEVMIREYISGRWPDASPWRVAPAGKLTKIWQDAARLGIVRDEKGLQAIRERFIDNYLRLSVNTTLAGHSTCNFNETLDVYFSDKDEKDRFIEWAITCDTGFRISDYGLEHLFQLCAAASEADDPDTVLMLCDLILNVTHQRSDMASWFVEGGTKTLNRLAEGQRPSERQTMEATL